MHQMPIVRESVLAGVLAHGRNSNPVAKRDFANLQRCEKTRTYFHDLGTFQAAADMIVDPVVIPPLDWIYLHAVYLHRKVKMVPARQACGSAFSHLLATAHHLAFLDRDLA